MTEGSMPHYTINGQDIHVHEEGKSARGNMAVLIHGWSSSWFAISPLLPYLGQRHQCYAIDLPGYGESPAPEHRITIPDYVEVVAEFIRQVSPDKPVVLVGHSMGGMTSVALTLKYPELVERLVLLCPTISGQLSFRINLALTPFVILERFRLTSAIVGALEPVFGITDALLRPVLFADRSGITEEDYKRIKSDTRRRDQGRVRAECFRAMRENDLRGQLHKLQEAERHVPALVIWGMEDNTVPLRDASVVAEDWPEADLRIIPNAGHWPQFETPEMTERYLRAFLSTPLKLLTLEI
jgi:pimeloyl-ACP methyl ester carboxylesterase